MGEIKASVLGFKEGLQAFEHVELVRIVSDKYNLLILKDYMPVLGETHGKVEIVQEDGDRTETYEEIDGFFIHRNNEFELLITEDDYVE